MYALNKLAWLILNPLTLGFVGLLFGLLAACRHGRTRRLGVLLVMFSAGGLWFLSTGYSVCMLGLPLERPFMSSQTPADLPAADAIVLLGGGMGKVDALANPEMFEAADRVWHAARLYRAGKAPLVVVVGSNDLAATVPLLLDFGVPREAIAVDDVSRNTYENSRFAERLLVDRGVRRVLLVTSAWHMPRAIGNFSRTSLEVTPAACDFKAHYVRIGIVNWWSGLMPSADNLNTSAYLLKEWLGKLARK